MAMSNPVIHKKKRGPAPTGKTPLVALRVPAALSARLDHWMAAQSPPQPSRSEAIRRLVEKGLAAENLGSAPQLSDADLDKKIADQKAKIAEMPDHAEASPEAALAKMDKALAKNDLVKLKNKRTLRTKAKT